MARTTLVSTNARIDALALDMGAMRSDLADIKALLSPTAPAKARTTRKAQAVVTPKDEAFVTWVRDTAEARAARKATNAEAATWLRAKGLPTGGSVWDAYKAGERTVATLKALAKKDAKARAAK